MIEDFLKKRSNITFFSKKIPDKQIIKDIIEKAHNLTPHKNNFWHYEIDVYGPEHEEQKRKVALATVCSGHKDFYRQTNLTDQDWKNLDNSYQDWLDFHHGDETKSYVIKDKWHFNEQVTAPYLLGYYPAEAKVKESQKQGEYFTRGRASEVFSNLTKVSKDEFNMQAGMHSMVTSMLALEQGLDVSFCKCYFYNKHIHTDVLERKGLTFLLGIGYRDQDTKQYKSWIEKPELDEVVKWR